VLNAWLSLPTMQATPETMIEGIIAATVTGIGTTETTEEGNLEETG